MRHRNGLAVGLALPVPPGREVFAERNNLCLEFYFSDAALAATTEDGRGLELAEPEANRIQFGSHGIEPDGQLSVILQEHRPPGLTRIASGKDVFAREVVPGLADEEFAPFHALFDRIAALLAADA